MDLLELFRAEGISLKKAASTHGGELAGACPVCREGTDRCRVWPALKGGRWWCRICGKGGDAIQYLIEVRGISYPEACNVMGIDVKQKGSVTRSRDEERPVFVPRESIEPCRQWQERAREFLNFTIQTMLRDTAGAAARRFLRRRGLADQAVDGAGLGWNPVDAYHDRSRWGLPVEKREDGRAKRLWLPAGLVIPCIGNSGRVMRIRIRRPDPGDGARYVLIPGSSSCPMAWGLGKSSIAVLESELDGVLVNQEAGDLIGVVALGSVSAKPDATTHDVLKRAGLILVSLDSDKAGAKAAWGWWAETYGEKIRRWPVPVGKDPSDALQKGLNVRTWIEAALLDQKEGV